MVMTSWQFCKKNYKCGHEEAKIKLQAASKTRLDEHLIANQAGEE